MTETRLTDASPEFAIALAESDSPWVTRTRWAEAIEQTRRFGRALRDPGVTVPGGILVFIVLACFAGPALFNIPGPNVGSLTGGLEPFGSNGHILGTDNLGNDMLSRLMFGGRVSLEVGFFTTLIGVAIGTTIGMIAGYLGGVVDGLVMRALDVMLAFPGIILALAIVTWLGPSQENVIFALSFFSVPAYARLARSQTLNVGHRDFVTAARISGARWPKVVRQHVFRNVLPTLLTVGMLTIGTVMLAEAALSYLGLGIKPPQPSWGNLITTGQAYMSTRPSLLLEPAICIFLTVLNLNLLGDGLRRRFALDR
jgi:peptide/nickel transport system permease protein